MRSKCSLASQRDALASWAAGRRATLGRPVPRPASGAAAAALRLAAKSRPEVTLKGGGVVVGRADYSFAAHSVGFGRVIASNDNR